MQVLPDCAMDIVVKLLATPPSTTYTGTAHPVTPAGTAISISSNPVQHPDRPAYITVAGWLPTYTCRLRLGMLPGSGPAASLPDTGPIPVPQISIRSPGFA